MAVAATLVAPGTALAARWCGNDIAATNRQPESFTGKQIHAVYAFPAGGNDRFVGWRGACTGPDPACSVVMDAPKTVTAVFGPAVYRLSLSVVGRGTVRTSEGQRCARRCALDLEPGSTVRLTAKAGRGFRFVRWSGSCRGKRACVVRRSAHRSVTAVFRRR